MSAANDGGGRGAGGPVRWRVPALVLIASLGLGAIATVLAASEVREESDVAFEQRARDARTAIERRITAYAEALYGLRSLLAADPRASRPTFHRYVAAAGLDDRRPGIQALAFSRLVTRSQVPSLEGNVRRDDSLRVGGYPDFRVHPPSPYDDRYVIVYIEPYEGNEAALGYDLANEPVRRVAMVEARDSGDLAATGPVLLVQEREGKTGFLLFLALYEGDSPPLTAPARRRRFLGMVSAAFRVEDVLAGVLGTSPHVRIEEIYDVGRTVDGETEPLERGRLLLDAGPALSARLPGSLPDLHRFLDLNVGSRRWRMLLVPQPGRSFGPAPTIPWITGVATVVVTAMLAGLIASFARSRRRALALAAEMTRDLRAREGELERANVDLEEVNVRLEGTNRAIREFLAIASHDMRSPLATIIGFAHVLLESGAVEGSARSALEAVDRNARRLAQLVNDLLMTSEIESGVLEPRAEDLSVGGAIAEVLAELPERGDDVSARCPEGLAASVDAGHLSRILTNLVGNCLKYGAAPIVVEARERDGWVEIEVSDAGPGVAPEFVPRLFEKFARADPDWGSKKEGTGLGLAIVRGLARANGGDAWYAPRAPHGSTFGVRLRPPARRRG